MLISMTAYSYVYYLTFYMIVCPHFMHVQYCMHNNMYVYASICVKYVCSGLYFNYMYAY